MSDLELLELALFRLPNCSRPADCVCDWHRFMAALGRIRRRLCGEVID